MKINSNISKNFMGCFDEARGFAMHKSKIIKSKKNNCLSYMQNKLIIYMTLIIISSILILSSCYDCNLLIIALLLFHGANIYLIITIISIISMYHFRKKNNFKNTIIIDKDGIIDESYYGIKMIFKWNKIIGIIIGKHTVTILTDTPCYFYFPISEKDNIIKAIDKYGDKSKIIN